MVYDECWEKMTNAFEAIGVVTGDMLYIASDVSLLLAKARKEYNVKTVDQRNTFLNEMIDTLQNIVGSQGTILFPVFSWEFCRGHDFDIKNTKSEVGALNNWVLENRRDFSRTQHPIYSFMVWGRQSDELLAQKNIGSFGSDSPFAYLHHHGGKMVLLNVSLQRGFTFIHYVEEAVKVPYRYMKNFRGTYIDGLGNKSERSYTMYVRDLAIESEEYIPDEMLECKGIVKISHWGKVVLKSFMLSESYSIIKDDLLYNNGRLCYRFANYALEWGKGATHADDLSN